MTDKEKLVELLINLPCPNALYGGLDSFEENADYLIANGVTVLTPDEDRNIYTAQEIEKLQGEAYDLGVESVLHDRFGLSWHDAEEVRKEVAKLQTTFEWLPVTERLPELIPCGAGTAYSEAVNVLTSGRKVLTAIWDGTDFIADSEFWEAEGEEITHWTPVLMPLPEPPKGDCTAATMKWLQSPVKEGDNESWRTTQSNPLVGDIR